MLKYSYFCEYRRKKDNFIYAYGVKYGDNLELIIFVLFKL